MVVGLSKSLDTYFFWTQSSFPTHRRTFLHHKSNVFFSTLWLWLMWIQALEDAIVLYLRMWINIIIFYLLKSCWIFVPFVVLDMKVHSATWHNSNFNEVLSRFSDCDHLQPSPFIIKTICGFPSTYIHMFFKTADVHLSWWKQLCRTHNSCVLVRVTTQLTTQSLL